MSEAGRAQAGPEPQFECELPATARSLARLRARFSGWLTAIGVGDFGRRDLTLTISELAAATLGDGSVGGHRLRARAWRDDEGVVIEVTDHGDVVDARARSLDAVHGGRGLAIVASLADVLTVRHVDGAKAMRAHIGWGHLASQSVSR
jgi:anti-sigma regulatory factor (Ser/Thr protein kinase)